MTRALCLYFPHLSIDGLRRRDRRRGAIDDPRPTIIAATTAHARREVSACCERASAAGVRRGMPLAEARALFRTPVRVEEHDPERCAALLRALAVRAQRFAPRVAPRGEDAVLADISGCARLFQSESRLVRGVLRHFRVRGLRCRGAAAPSPEGALALARHAAGDDQPLIIADLPGLRAALAGLPTAALPIEPHTIDALGRVGVERIGQLLALPRAALPARFGAGLVTALDLALGVGGMVSAFENVREPVPEQREFTLDGPSDRPDAIEGVTRLLLDRLSEDLRRRGLGASEIEVTLFRPRGEPAAVRAQLGRPSARADHLWSLLRPRLERVDLELGGGVQRIVVVAVRTDVPRETQGELIRAGSAGGALGGETGMDAAGSPDAELDRLVDTLASRLGHPSLGVFDSGALERSHIPERAAQTRGFAGEPDPDALRGRVLARALPRRPPLLLHPPETCRVDLERSWTLLWRGVERAVTASIGPERIAPEWWRDGAEPRTREYFLLQDSAGLWLWVYRAVEDRSWFVHGVWA